MPKIPSKSPEEEIPLALKPYAFHKLDIQHKRGAKDATTDCPFCGRVGKLNINVENTKCGCVVCGEPQNGNQHNFLKALQAKSLEATKKNPAALEKLRENRKLLAVETLLEWGICQSVIDRQWLIPGYNEKRSMTNLYRYQSINGRMACLPTPECGGHALFGMNLFDPKKSVTILCEGVWDGASLYEVLSRAKPNPEGEGYVPTGASNTSMLSDKNVLAFPAARVFKESWLPLFKDQTVILLGQNDHPHKNEQTGEYAPPASYSGMERIARMLQKSKDPPSDIRFLHWGDNGYDPELPTGYDVRDFLRKNGEALASRLMSLSEIEGKVRSLPREWILDDPRGSGGHAKSSEGKELTPLECSDYKVLITAWRKAMQWRQGMDDVLSTMLAVAASTVQVGDQLFLQVIGSAGGGKTKFCDALLVSKNCYPLEHLTGFHSGWKDASGEDYSLISRMDRKTLITPEGDVIMSSPSFGQIMSEQRRIFDGTSGASFKNQKEDSRYTGLRTPWIMAGTPAMMDTDQSRLGDRFLKVFIDDPDEDEKREILLRCGYAALNSVMQTSNGEAGKQIDGKYALAFRLTGGYVDYLRANVEELLAELRVDADELVNYCARLGEFTADLRARPDPEANKKDSAACKEMGTRLTHQFVRLACCLAVVLNKKTIDQEVLRRVRKVALDTSKGVTLEIVKFIRKMEVEKGVLGVEVKAVHLAINKSEEKTRQLLRFMRDIGVLRYSEPKAINGVHQKPRWFMTSRMEEVYRDVMENS